MIDETPVMILPENRDAPAPVTIERLCGINASALEKAILNGSSAEALTAAGKQRKPRASTATTTGAGVGLGVGVGARVGAGVGFGLTVGLGVGVAVVLGVGDAAGVEVADGAAVAVATGSVLRVGSDGEPAEGAESVGTSVGGVDALTDAVGATAGSPDRPATGDPGAAELGADPLQAATSRPTPISFGNRAGGTAAL